MWKRPGRVNLGYTDPASGNPRLRIVFDFYKEMKFRSKEKTMKVRLVYIFGFIYILVATTGDCMPASQAIFISSAIAAPQPIKMAGTPTPVPEKVPPSKTNSSPNTSVGKDVCLGCHGPFDELAAAPITFTADNGDKINPHRHVPHNRSDEKSVVECTKCHKPHPVPLTSKAEVAKPNVEWCFSCHHTNDFLPCKACHQH